MQNVPCGHRVPTRHSIAKWDDAAWSALGSGVDDYVYALAWDASSGVLYVGGDFESFGSVSGTSEIAKWDGAALSALGSGVDGPVFALAWDASSGSLYVGGDFGSAGGVSGTSQIAKWDGAAWSALGGLGFRV